MSQIDRRTAQRFDLKLPLRIRWSADDDPEVASESKDVSSRGVYFYLSGDVKKGSPVEIVMTLPHEITLAGPVLVRCLGRVQRTESRNGAKVGVVAAIERYEFVRSRT